MPQEKVFECGHEGRFFCGARTPRAEISILRIRHLMITTTEIKNAELAARFDGYVTQYIQRQVAGSSYVITEGLGQSDETDYKTEFFLTHEVDHIGSADVENRLLLTRAVYGPERFNIAFIQLVKDEERLRKEAHLWLKNALEEIVIAKALVKQNTYITAIALDKLGEKTLLALGAFKVNGVCGFEKTYSGAGVSVCLTIALPSCLHRFKGIKAFDEFKPGDCLRPPNLLRNIKWDRPTHTCALIDGEHCPFPGGPFVVG
ncbi:MAG: hypothetical protein A3J24_13115 [Deltaproteobacteria bacterium RIFCSPLOWO2_02_FULL_53_8]|nr:MAG: hypothetical protein A3J24_13115 [Deltaproteobacteria bacterium RIFCSPLOWO2_02_FULL_53_8]